MVALLGFRRGNPPTPHTTDKSATPAYLDKHESSIKPRALGVQLHLGVRTGDHTAVLRDLQRKGIDDPSQQYEPKHGTPAAHSPIDQDDPQHGEEQRR